MDTLVTARKELCALWSIQLVFATLTTGLSFGCSWVVNTKLFYSCENDLGLYVGSFAMLVAILALISLCRPLERMHRFFFVVYVIICFIDIICCGVLIHISGKCFKYWSAVLYYDGSEASDMASWLNMAVLFVCLIHTMCCVFSYLILLWDCCCWCRCIVDVEPKTDLLVDDQIEL